MRKLLNKLDLTQLYERFNSLVTNEGKNHFVRIVYTLSLCAVATIVLWYFGFLGLSSQKQNDINQIAEMQNHMKAENKTIDQNYIGNNPPGKEKKVGTKDKSEVQSTKKSCMKTIYMGANTSQVAVTFDDGYCKKNVERVLDVLKSNNVKSTFFIIGKVLDDYPEVWKRAVREGHQICNHTNLHEILTNMPDNLVQEEILGWETSAKKVLGEGYVTKMKKDFPFLRLPGGGGAKNDRILSIAQENGYTVVGWNVETFSSVINPLRRTHSQQYISNKIEQHVTNKCSNGAIILLHFNKYDIGNIDGIIRGIKNHGYDMQLLSQIIK